MIPSIDDKSLDRDIAILRARIAIQADYCVMDTETTGLNNPHMCQFAMVMKTGEKFVSLVKPSVPIEPGATQVHHITNEQVQEAPGIEQVIASIPDRGFIIIYNAPFDLGVIHNSAKAANITWSISPGRVIDAMQIYSAFRGEWDDYHGNYKWHKLGKALEQCNIKIDLELHDALADALMTDLLMKYIAHQTLSTEKK